jgi:pimeloyl-ACP methyl ester carboxylesterase
VVVQHVTKVTGGQKPVYIGHSQGATQALLASAINPAASERLALFVGLAPAYFVRRPMGSVAVGRVLCGMPAWLRRLLFGRGPFMPLMCLVQRVLPGWAFASLAGTMFEFLMTWRRTLWCVDRHAAYFRFTPTVVSSKLACDWFSCLVAGGILVDPSSPVSNVHPAPRMACPVALIWGKDDELVDGALLAKEIERRSDPGTVTYATGIAGYSHLLWAHDAPDNVFEPIANLIEAH